MNVNGNRYQQQDAFEFVSRVLECLGQELNRVLVQEYQELSDSAGKRDAEVARDYWESTEARENNIITALFTGGSGESTTHTYHSAC